MSGSVPSRCIVAGAGVASGRYHDLITATLDVLRRPIAKSSIAPVRSRICSASWPRSAGLRLRSSRQQAPQLPVRPVGPATIDNSGNYRRFVLQAVTLDALLDRVNEQDRGDKYELLAEAAAVLAGTMLMAAGVSAAWSRDP